ncbi:alanine aminotransferase 1-like [Centruroides sculpturatus]|uniref:alanine aminotransferase 1-like n=1 Tax=Centruroides sculpturatus TaxID=218467 RepID=UPI000C6D86F0|nr:alanine aminotransferase 1-like [Centruroides sculpturatus]
MLFWSRAIPLTKSALGISEFVCFKMSLKTLTLDTINPNIKKMQYAVRGPLVIRATAIEKELEKGEKKPFQNVIKANIGDCQAMGQKPITFIRQVITLCTYPELLNSDDFPSDVKERAKTILSGCGGGSVGSYSDSAGVEIIKKHVAQYIERRDGIPSDYNNIILSTGASEAIKSVLSLLNYSVSDKLPGVMTPIPQYPLYSATLAEYNMEQIGYYLDEDNEWALSIDELKNAISKAKETCEPRAIVVINPGNPTGSVLTRENIEKIIKFAYEEKLFILADEHQSSEMLLEVMQLPDISGEKNNKNGSYSDSAGVEIIKKHVAQYIERRDGIPSDYNNIILSTGASEAIKSVLSLLNYSVSDKLPGVMTPIPQYPLYSATLAEYNMEQIGYYLDEDNEWALSIDELKNAISKAKETCEPRAIVVINPGNPTGSVLTRENIEKIIKFAYEEKLFILADEVSTDLKSVLNNVKIYIYMDIKVKICGLRGGYCEIINLDPDVKAMLLKLISARLCSSVLGQATMDCVVNPPQKGEPSYELFIKEKTAILNSLKERAKLVANTFNSIEGIKCNEVAGAMYAFPQLFLPEKAIQKAKSLNQEPDFFYAMQLLENTGICIVPGSGFGQRPGTYHFRTTILPQPDKLKIMMKRFKEFHEKFLKMYK